MDDAYVDYVMHDDTHVEFASDVVHLHNIARWKSSSL